MADVADLPAIPEKKRGRPSDPNKILFRSMGLRAKWWKWLEQWWVESDGTTEKGVKNLTPAFERMVQDAYPFFPGGPMVEKPRDDKGRFLPENGTSKMAICRRKRRERREREEAEA